MITKEPRYNQRSSNKKPCSKGRMGGSPLAFAVGKKALRTVFPVKAMVAFWPTHLGGYKCSRPRGVGVAGNIVHASSSSPSVTWERMAREHTMTTTRLLSTSVFNVPAAFLKLLYCDCCQRFCESSCVVSFRRIRKNTSRFFCYVPCTLRGSISGTPKGLQPNLLQTRPKHERPSTLMPHGEHTSRVTFSSIETNTQIFTETTQLTTGRLVTKKTKSRPPA